VRRFDLSKQAEDETRLYDPREGFILTDPTVHDIGHYNCDAKYNDSSESVIIFVNVISKSTFVLASQIFEKLVPLALKPLNKQLANDCHTIKNRMNGRRAIGNLRLRPDVSDFCFIVQPADFCVLITRSGRLVHIFSFALPVNEQLIMKLLLCVHQQSSAAYSILECPNYRLLIYLFV